MKVIKTTRLTPHGCTEKSKDCWARKRPSFRGMAGYSILLNQWLCSKQGNKNETRTKESKPCEVPRNKTLCPFWCSHVAHTSIHQNSIFIYGTFPSVLHYVIDFQTAFFFPRRKVKLLLSWLLKDGVYFKSSVGFTTNLTDFEDCFLSKLWLFLCFFRFTYINNINNKYFYILSRCMCVCMCRCMHAHTTAYM